VTLLVPAPVHSRVRTTDAGGAAVDVTGGAIRDLVISRGATPTIEVAGLLTDAECAVLTGADREDQRLYLLGASFVEGDGLERETVPAGSPYLAQRERGRWTARPFQERSPE
jgi:hypothetical protein